MSKELDGNPPAAALTGAEKWAGIQSGADVTFTLSSITSAVTTPNATTAVKGKVKLAGDLAGTADLPTVPGLAVLQAAIDALAARVTTLENTINDPDGWTIP